MPILDRYVGLTVLKSIVLVLAIIVGLDALSAFIDEVQNTSGQYTFVDVIGYVLLTVPRRIYEFVPFAALIGCLVGLGQLASTSEIVVMRSGGVSIARLVWIVMQPTLLVACAGFLIGEYVGPAMEQIAESQKAIARSKSDRPARRGGVWKREGDTYFNIEAVGANDIVYGIKLLEFDSDFRLRLALRAERAVFREEKWTMEAVVKTEFGRTRTIQTVHASLPWDTGITPDLLSMVVIDPQFLPVTDLYRYSRYLNKQGLDADDYRLAMWKKLLQPLAVAGLVIVAISFIFGPLRDGTMGFRIFSGVIIGIVFRTVQDLLGPASLVFGFSPVLAAVLPIVLCVVAGVFMLRRSG